MTSPKPPAKAPKKATSKPSEKAGAKPSGKASPKASAKTPSRRPPKEERLALAAAAQSAPPRPAAPPDPAKEALAWAHSARFFITAAQLHQLPVSELPEVAFVGRSNAGKSTAINTLAQQRQLAYASKTPGRTQHINLFHLGPKAAPDQIWTDLPGYGYAAVERTAKLRWQEVMANYLKLRRNLTAVVQMVDARHGFTDLDKQLLEFVTPRVRNGEVKLLVLLTKADKLNRKEGAESLRQAQAVLAELATDEADIGITLFSSLKKIGVGDAAEMLKAWAVPPEVAQAIAEALAAEQAEALGQAENLDAGDHP
jgi:GTP-binding protein